MSLPYSLRLVCLCLACFFLVHLAIGLMVAAAAPAAVRMAERLRAGAAARFLLALRIAPVAVALFAVAGLCVPSYLWLEPGVDREEAGPFCLAAAMLGAAIWAISMARTGRALLRSRRWLQECRQAVRETRVDAEHPRVWVIESKGPVVALAGVADPRLILSGEVVRLLSSEELNAVLRHEAAHRAVRDNLKRLVVLLAPGTLPFWSGFGALERGWGRLIEWAADDRTVSGDPRRAVALAGALVRVARLGAAAVPSPLTASLMADGQELAARVNRLLEAPTDHAGGSRGTIAIRAGWLVLAASVLALVQPATLASVHRLLEELIR